MELVSVIGQLFVDEEKFNEVAEDDQSGNLMSMPNDSAGNRKEIVEYS